ncbi:UDP-2,4-diacetamido-2,4,6-trideoxy-beta-L-altropyranose hydrolase [Marinobacter panjinensis]|uniref:UDP-2,4-diacetamido-2,4, 6-trideoxy-beta-L-altropyranose hydrolase n=1 Tax=Marinobacter panjinensis TaxID=2576384 RepID=A0A4U6R2N6_9GAMM|nr:UDP-2,4-diacetamido-2,4,6-trideoxy-beta-L-altropyranose hydrolase [Marinobacter panjinensis]MCR8913698.1 UDP-2,4-diacetamido-2,4,6-trideoxy-beta-L-altropyranose hydrolase [Marinobacter panjinensis]TKV67651.1 UDP-2,4-diacetamido-2,4,6-trideoxy-beta-L-altropyranose hydrolase [Marinobacter panjinensis]
MNFVFRTDASISIGTGHVMRCLTLAQELRRQGHQCRFICRDHSGHLGDLIVDKGFYIDLLSAPADEVENPAHASKKTFHAAWLGVGWQLDAEQTLEAIDSVEVDWLVVDHYSLDSRWELKVRGAGCRVMVVDDLADRPHHADLLLDQNILGPESESPYKSLVNAECVLLLGPRYAMLGHEYSLLSRALPYRDNKVLRVLIFVGGSDPHHLTESYLQAVATPEFQHLQVNVVLGKNHPAPEAVEEIARSRKGTALFSGLPSLAAQMIRCDLMLGGGGATNWERMCLGLTTIVVSVAHNQYETCQQLAKHGLINFVGVAEEISIEDIQRTLRGILGDSPRRVKQMEMMRNVVDGYGTERIVKRLI